MIDTCYVGDVRDGLRATEAELAYCAGVIDSDGTIGVKRSTYGMRHNNGGQATYSERVCVRQVERQAVDLLRSLFGGSFGSRAANAKRGKPLWEWQVTDAKAALCLAALLPFLRIKREQAVNCLALREVKNASKRDRVGLGRGHQGSAPRSAGNSALMHACFDRAKVLNRVGI